MENTIRTILGKYHISPNSIVKLGDTSKNDEDIRVQYLVNDAYVMKLNTAKIFSEPFLKNISRLAERYRAIGVWAPKLYRTVEGNFITEAVIRGQKYYVYIEEYAPYKTAENIEEQDVLKQQLIAHIGLFAAKYSGVELMDVPSMWTIIDLHPLDEKVDEKQSNLNKLIKTLKENGYTEEAELLEKKNAKLRAELQKRYKKLPRCVYQGDLNFSNVLIDENDCFKGLIDFNLAGTEVNINNFLNETAYYLDEQDFIDLSAEEIYEKMNERQELLMDIVLKNYFLNEEEKLCFPLYKKIIDMSLYPNVMLWVYMLRNNKNVGKILQLLRLICET